MNERITNGRWSRIGASLAALLVAVCPLAAQQAGTRSGPLLRGGRAALEDGQHDLAVRLFREALDLPDAPEADRLDARVGLARAAFATNDFAAMLRALPPLTGTNPPASAAYRYYRALALDGMGASDDALAELDLPALDAASGGVASDSLRLRAWILMKRATWAEADRAFAAWEETSASTNASGVTSLLAWTDALAATGRVEEAERVLKRFLQKPLPTGADWTVRLHLVRVLAARGDDAGVEAETDRLTAAESPETVRMEAWLIRAALEDGRTNGASACAAASNAVALAKGPAESRRARVALGRLLLKNGALREGSERLKGVIAEDPADPQAPVLQLTIARAFLDGGQPADAELNYRYYLESFTNAAGVLEALEGRSWAQLEQARYAEAAAGFEKAAGLAGEPVRRDRLLFKAGDAYFADRHYQLAAERYQAVLESGADPALALEARYQRAETDARLGRLPDALAGWAELEKAAPPDLAERAALRIAEWHQETGALETARKAYDRFLALYTNSARAVTALYNRGLVAYQTYRFEAAMADFEAVLARQAANGLREHADYMRVCTAFQLYGDARARELAKGFLESWPASTWAPQVRFREAEFIFNRGDYGLAETNFLAVADGGTKDALAGDALFWAARSAAARKQFRRALELDARLAKDYPDHPKAVEALFYQGDGLVKQGDYPAAMAIFDEVARRQPDSYLGHAARLQRGECLVTLGADDPVRFEEAIRVFRDLAATPGAPFELRLQASYRIGRILQKQGRLDDAMSQYYEKVILVFLEARQSGVPVNEMSAAWFTQASFDAAAIQEGRQRWREAVRCYQRVVDAGVPAADDARRRIELIQRERWRFF